MDINYILYVIFWITYIIAIIIGIEIFGYIWHRYGAHNYSISGVYDTHMIHHILEIDLGHEANEDFLWILLMMTVFELIVGIGIIIGVIPGILAIITIIISLTVFWWNWWIHSAYHQKDHWLNLYEWFRIEKERHYIHHSNPGKNYGIASHFADKFMGSWLDINSETKLKG